VCMYDREEREIPKYERKEEKQQDGRGDLI
jgi:hypothetical protein